MKRLLLCVLLLVSWFGVTLAQPADLMNMTFKQVGTEQGLSNLYVTTVLRTSDGFLWIGTRNGLLKSDGVSYTIYSTGSPSSLQLVNNVIVAIKEMPNHKLAVLSSRGLSVIDTNGVVISQMKIAPGMANSLPLDEYNDILPIPKENAVLLAGKRALYHINLSTKKTTVFSSDKRLLNGVNKLFPSSQGQGFWALTEFQGGLFFNFGKGNVVKSVAEGKGLTTMFQWQNKLYFGLSAGNLLLVDGEKETYITVGNKQVHISEIRAYQDKLLIGTQERGLFILDNQSNKVLTSYYHTVGDVQGLPSNAITSIEIDNQSIMWIGTNNGMAIFDPERIKFRYFTNLFRVYEGEQYEVNAVVQLPSKQIWVGTSNGIDIYTEKMQFSNALQSIKGLSPTFLQGSIQELVLQKNNLWIGGTNGLALLTANNGKFLKQWSKVVIGNIEYRLDVTSLVAEADTGLWVGTYGNGLFYLHIPTNTWKVFQYAPELQFSLSHNQVNCLLLTPNSDLIVGTRAGLNLFNRKYSNFVVLNCYGEEGKTLSSDHITAIANYKNSIWVGTLDGGLSEYSEGNKSFKTYTSLAGNPVTTIHSLTALDNKLWVTSGNRLFVLEGEKVVNHYASSAGIQLQQFTKAASYSPNGQLILGGIGGLIAFSPAAIIRNKVSPKPIITAIQINGTAISLSDQLNLAADENYINIWYTSLNLSAPDENTFQYRLLGSDTTWLQGGTSRTVAFNALNPGSYTFQIRALNNDGISSEIKTLQIKINPTIYASLWFRILVSVIVLSIVGYILYLVINKIKQEKEIAEFSTRLTSLRNQALQSQLNPHFIFNALNSIQEVVLSGDSKGAGIYLNKFARLLRRILEYSGIDTISLTEELKTIELYLEVESLRFSNEFNWEVQLEEDLDTDDFLIPPLLLQPIVENAIWHGLRQKPGNKVITIDIALLQTQLSIGITDNGVGFNSDEPKPATQHKKKSLGISFTKERLSVYDAQQGTVSTMDISPSVTGGTQVLLLIGQSWLLTEK